MRLIDADELKYLLGENITVLKFNQDFDGLIAEIIDNAPTVEERIEYGTDGNPYTLSISNGSEYSRPTGEWIEDSGVVACSHCRVIWLYRKTKYCPNCGAKMKGAGK